MLVALAGSSLRSPLSEEEHVSILSPYSERKVENEGSDEGKSRQDRSDPDAKGCSRARGSTHSDSWLLTPVF